MLAATALALLIALATSGSLEAQGRFHGRARAEHPSLSGDAELLSGIRAVVSPHGSRGESFAFRTFETEPVGWFQLFGAPGEYTAVFTTPAHWARPVVLTNLLLEDGREARLLPRSKVVHASLSTDSWDSRPALAYAQPFVATGPSVTAVGFRLATDGVDGQGPESQDLLLEIRVPGSGSPLDWPRVGPPTPVLDVDCGGAKGYWFSGGWASGEVPTRIGERYAVVLRPKESGRSIQTFWSECPQADSCWRVGPDGVTRPGKTIWLAVSGDGDGLLIAYPKRVHARFRELTRFGRSWSQSWVAKGRGLASVVLYAAVSGTQPPLSRQRVRVTIHRAQGEGHGAQGEGEAFGTSKVAIGNGDYTGDASWGVFGAAWAPGEVRLEPGVRYIASFESIESTRTLRGFVNIKGVVSDERPGFNPYRKAPGDDCPEGEARFLGTEPVDYDLDLQIVEYEHDVEDWIHAVEGPELLVDRLAQEPGESGWRPFRRLEATKIGRETPEGSPPRLWIEGSERGGPPVDGGLVQAIRGLSPDASYRLGAKASSTWPLDEHHRVALGIDRTGQTDDADAATIVWTPLPVIHGEVVPWRPAPVRPRGEAISVWARGIARRGDQQVFRAEFQELTLRRVACGVPKAR